MLGVNVFLLAKLSFRDIYFNMKNEIPTHSLQKTSWADIKPEGLVGGEKLTLRDKSNT